ncbi:MAG: competence type IV pilus major pilin ComGC [Eubacteriaceae bacterium]|jgi:general secretion pathway protein G|nr:type pilus assembly protein PilA [Eubacteriaceae bacterium]MDK2961886.1 type pilus assembly protein PilA [Eubacteriaceae bacterium]
MIKDRVRKNDGFTLAELMVVLVILGLLASIAIPQFFTVIKNSQKKTDETNIRIVESALELYRIENGEYPPSATTFDGLIDVLHDEGLIRQESIESANDREYELYYNVTDHTIERKAITTATE